MNGFGFIEYEDPLDARDVVPGKLQNLRLGIFTLLTIISQPSVRP